MKHWSELNELETQIIRLDTLRSLFTVLVTGAESSRVEDIHNSLCYIEGSLSDIHASLRSEFDCLWEAISDDEHKELVEKLEKKHQGGMKKKKEMTDRELP